MWFLNHCDLKGYQLSWYCRNGSRYYTPQGLVLVFIFNSCTVLTRVQAAFVQSSCLVDVLSLDTEYLWKFFSIPVQNVQHWLTRLRFQHHCEARTFFWMAKRISTVLLQILCVTIPIDMLFQIGYFISSETISDLSRYSVSVSHVDTVKPYSTSRCLGCFPQLAS